MHPNDDDISHDKLFKDLFETFLKDLLELVHPDLAAMIDLDHPTFLDKDLFADFSKEGHVEPDLVAEILSREDEPQLLWVHVETEARFLSSIDRRMESYALHLMLKTQHKI